MKKERLFWAGAGLLVVATILASRPSCNRGCRTLAEHLIEHGISDIVTAMLA
jgi:hypothetical protein